MGRVILAYHRVCPRAAVNAVLHDTVVEPELFDQHLRFLSRNFSVVPLSDFLAAVQRRDNSKKNLATITFDDNYRDNLIYALPLLKKYAFAAAVFVSTGFINTNRVFWWDHLAHILSQNSAKPAERQKIFFRLSGQLKKSDFNEQDEFFASLYRSSGAEPLRDAPQLLGWEDMKVMVKEGIIFGSHGHSHRVFSSLSDGQALEELALSKRLLESNLGINAVNFAFPHGERKDFDPERARGLLKKSGYQCGLTMLQGAVRQGDDLNLLRRIGIGYSDTRWKFLLKLNGIIPYASKLKQGLYGIISRH